MSQPLVTIGLLTYNSEKYLPFVLPTIKEQDYENVEVVILDNNSTDDSVKYIKKHFPEFRIIESKKNTGFGKGHNAIIRQSEAKYYLCTNVDMMLEPDFVSKIVECAEKHPKCGSVTGKLRKWDFEKQKKTSIIDSVGLTAQKNFAFHDMGEGVEDTGQFDEEAEIFGCSGACALFRISALSEVAWHNKTTSKREYYDELMFMYKEDIDLAIRLRLGGFQSFYTPKAVAYHDRTGKKENIWKRKQEKAPYVRKYSYLHQRILENRYIDAESSMKTKIGTKIRKFARGVYVQTFERDLLASKRDFWSIRHSLEEKKAQLPSKVSKKELEKRWFQ